MKIEHEDLKKLAEEYVIPGVMEEIRKKAGAFFEIWVDDAVEKCVAREVEKYFSHGKPGYYAPGLGIEKIRLEVKDAVNQAMGVARARTVPRPDGLSSWARLRDVKREIEKIMERLEGME